MYKFIGSTIFVRDVYFFSNFDVENEQINNPFIKSFEIKVFGLSKILKNN